MNPARFIPVVAVEEGLAEAFIEALAGEPTEKVEMPHPVGLLTLSAIKPGDIHGSALDAQLSNAAAVIVVTQHVDSVSMETLRRLHQRLPGDVFLPEAHALHREGGRPEFKLSCPHCGQKLWVGDQQEGRPGRCPGCKQTFLIPSQARHLAASLQLADIVPIRLLPRGDTAAAVALVHELADRLVTSMERQKSTTMRVMLTDEEA